MVEVWLPYGKTEVHISIPLRNLQVTLEPVGLDVPINNRELIKTSLTEPQGSESFTEIIKAGENIAIALDGTINHRICLSALTAITEICTSEEASTEKISVYIGSGLRESSSADLIQAIRGSDTLKNINLLEQVGDRGELADLGKTGNGTQLMVNKAFSEAEYKVALGEVSVDAFSGLRGAQTTILPALSGSTSIEQNRGLAFKGSVTLGEVEENNVHVDCMEAAEKVGVDLAVNLVTNGKGELTNAYSGGLKESWDAAYGDAHGMYKLEAESNADVVIVSAGGRKYDYNLYNAIWALSSARHVGHRSTSYILLAECRDGLGADGLTKLAQVESLAELRRRYMLGARAVYLLKQLTRRNEIHIVTALPTYLLEPLGVHVHRTANDALNRVYDRRNRGKKTTVITHGCSSIPYIPISEPSE